MSTLVDPSSDDFDPGDNSEMRLPPSCKKANLPGRAQIASKHIVNTILDESFTSSRHFNKVKARLGMLSSARVASNTLATATHSPMDASVVTFSQSEKSVPETEAGREQSL